MQGLPEGHTEACYPVLRPGVDSHRAPPLKDSDADKREVCQHSSNSCMLDFCRLETITQTMLVIVAVTVYLTMIILVYNSTIT